MRTRNLVLGCFISASCWPDILPGVTPTALRLNPSTAYKRLWFAVANHCTAQESYRTCTPGADCDNSWPDRAVAVKAGSQGPVGRPRSAVDARDDCHPGRRSAGIMASTERYRSSTYCTEPATRGHYQRRSRADYTTRGRSADTLADLRRCDSGQGQRGSWWSMTA
jgi:hypothetical protein